MRREPAVAVWVGMKAKVRVPTLREEREGWLTQTDEIKNPTPSRRSGQALSRKTRRGWGTRTKAERSYRTMDITWLDEEERIGVGGGIWNSANMEKVAKLGITHIIDMQIEFDDTLLGERVGVEVLWNPVDDDFRPKGRAVFERGVNFALRALQDPRAKLLVHCAAGIHRAPMMALAVMGAVGYPLDQAKRIIQTKRYVVDFAEVYVRSVEQFLKGYAGNDGRAGVSRKDGERRV